MTETAAVKFQTCVTCGFKHDLLVSHCCECFATFDDQDEYDEHQCDHKAIGPTAGIVRERGVDDVIETLEGQIDFVEGYASKFFEGHEIGKDEAFTRERELRQLASAINLRVADISVRIVGAFPELKGKGALLRGVDLAGREYSIELHLDDEQRMRGDTFDAMLDGLDTVNMIERGIRQRLESYLEEERMERLGIVRGKKAN